MASRAGRVKVVRSIPVAAGVVTLFFVGLLAWLTIPFGLNGKVDDAGLLFIHVAAAASVPDPTTVIWNRDIRIDDQGGVRDYVRVQIAEGGVDENGDIGTGSKVPITFVEVGWSDQANPWACSVNSPTSADADRLTSTPVADLPGLIDDEASEIDARFSETMSVNSGVKDAPKIVDGAAAVAPEGAISLSCSSDYETTWLPDARVGFAPPVVVVNLDGMRTYSFSRSLYLPPSWATTLLAAGSEAGTKEFQGASWSPFPDYAGGPWVYLDASRQPFNDFLRWLVPMLVGALALFLPSPIANVSSRRGAALTSSMDPKEGEPGQGLEETRQSARRSLVWIAAMSIGSIALSVASLSRRARRLPQRD